MAKAKYLEGKLLMQKTRIDWCDYTLNPVKGLCPMACSYCYARAMYKRFKWDETIYYDNNVWDGLFELDHKSRKKIFVGSTIELFGEWVKREWMEQIFRWVRGSPKHDFLFLTKQPQNLIKFSPFPKNCFVGVSVTNNAAMTMAFYGLSEIKASIKYISFEPLLGSIGMDDHVSLKKKWVDWIIIGSQTKPYKPPKIEWVQEIVEAADKAGITVFLKDNLKPILSQEYNKYPPNWAYNQGVLRQEMSK